MIMKEKIANILSGFLNRNKDYAVELCISNAVTNSLISISMITPIELLNRHKRNLF